MDHIVKPIGGIHNKNIALLDTSLLKFVKNVLVSHPRIDGVYKKGRN